MQMVSSMFENYCNRLGGWIDTTHNKDGIIYEHGPRTVRPVGASGANTLAMVEDLGLASKVRPIFSGHPITKNRLIFVDGKIYKLPSSISSIIRKQQPPLFPSFGGFSLFCAGIKDLFTPSKICTDDSLYNFVHRRFSEDLAKYAIGI